MPKRKLVLKINCGKSTCASKAGEFCKFVCTARMGTIHYCGIWFDQDKKGMPINLEVKDGWLQRRDECLACEESMPVANEVFQLIDSFVEKSGGIEKVRMAVKALRALAETKDDQVISGYVINVGKNFAGANQIIAAALLGFSMASALYKATEVKKK